jgi:polyphosphate kinase 2 (PPK2 family)
VDYSRAKDVMFAHRHRAVAWWVVQADDSAARG